MSRLKLAVFVSGRGSNLAAIFDAITRQELDAEVVAVISNRSAAGGLDIAREHAVPAIHLSSKQFENETLYIEALLETLTGAETELIVLAGYLKKLPVQIIQKYRQKIINIHPALLPSFGGKGLYGHYVHEAVLDYGCKVSGATVHFVDIEYDTGKPILQECVPVFKDDTSESLAARVLALEHKLLPKAITLFATGEI